MSKALHTQVAEYIRSRIVSGEYAVGSQIPTENELASRLGAQPPHRATSVREVDV